MEKKGTSMVCWFYKLENKGLTFKKYIALEMVNNQSSGKGL